jgi:iron complex outermembrane receptor protein
VNDLQLGYDFGGLSLAKDIKATLLINNIFNVKYANNGAAFGYFQGERAHYTSYYYPQAGTNFLARLTIGF